MVADRDQQRSVRCGLGAWYQARKPVAKRPEVDISDMYEMYGIKY